MSPTSDPNDSVTPVSQLVSVKELDKRIAACQQTLTEIEVRKQGRRTAKLEEAKIAAHEEAELPWDWKRKIVIDKVPRSVREAMKRYGLDD